MIRSPSNEMTLEQVTARLSRNDVVTGLLLIGSAGRGSLTPASDIDLIIVLAEMPVPLHVGVTYIDGMLTDLIFLRDAQIEDAVAIKERVPDDARLGRIVRWLDEGTILFDRAGRLTEAQAKARSADWLVRPAPGLRSTITSPRRSACWPLTTPSAWRQSTCVWHSMPRETWCSATSNCEVCAGRETRPPYAT
jgi:predicted nucleotidyltransferase